MVDDAAALALLQRFARTLVCEYDIDTVLSDLAGQLQTVLDVEGAGVMLADDDGHLRLTSSSDERLERLEDLQIRLGEGPCLSAYMTNTQVVTTDLRTDPRFRKFGPRAVEVGMLAVFSWPLHYEQETFGALNLYRSQPGSLDDGQEELGAAFADIAALYLMHGADDERREIINRQLRGALDSRVIIEQAKGFVASARDTTPDKAFDLLRSYARNHGTKLRAISLDVIERRLQVDDLVAHDT